MKKLAIYLGVGYALFWLTNQGKSLVSNYTEAIKRLSYKISNIKDIEWLGGLTDPSVRFKFDLDLINPTNLYFSLNAGEYITLTKLVFYDANGVEIMKTQPNISNIKLLPNATQKIKNLPGRIPVKKLGVALDVLKELKPNQLNLDVYVSVAGNEFKIERRS